MSCCTIHTLMNHLHTDNGELTEQGMREYKSQGTPCYSYTKWKDLKPLLVRALQLSIRII